MRKRISVNGAPREEQTEALSIQKWFLATLKDNVTAGNCGKVYHISPEDRGMLSWQPKRTRAGGRVCHLYSRVEVMKVARSKHFKKEKKTVATLRKVCVQLGIGTKGSYDVLRRRIGVKMATI